MPLPARHVVFVYRPENREGAAMCQEMAAWLARQTGADACALPFGAAFQARLAGQDGAPDLVVSVGGDGTMLSACRLAARAGVPVLGINGGKVGFLTQISAACWEEALLGAVAGHYRPSPRLMLECGVWRGQRRLPIGQDGADVALNEVCVARGSLARIMDFELFVDAERLGSVRADGIIFSTPTGATGYSVSAGGPMLLPEMEAFTITPVCPFLSVFPPLVVPGGAQARARVKNAGAGVLVTLDGHDSLALEKDDEVRIRQWDHRALLAILPGYSYFGSLREKGFVREQV